MKTSEIERELIRKYGIGLRMTELDPNMYYCNIWNTISTQLTSKLEEELAEFIAKRNHLKSGFFDMSKPGKDSFSEVSHVWYVSVVVDTTKETIESVVKDFVEKAKLLDKLYEEKLKILIDKILDLPVYSSKPIVEELLEEEKWL